MAVDLRNSPLSIYSLESSYNTPRASPWHNPLFQQESDSVPPPPPSSSSSSGCTSDNDSVIESFLNCLLCGKQMSHPIMLPCLDNFCIDCLRDSHNEQRQTRDRLRREEIERRNRRMRAGGRDPHQQEDDIPLVAAASINMANHSPALNGHGQPPSPSQSPSELEEDERSEIWGGSNGGESDGCIVDSHDDNSSTASNHSVGHDSALSNASTNPSVGSSQSGMTNYFRCPLNNCHHVVRAVSLDYIEQLDRLEVNLPLQNIRRTMSIKQELPQGHVKCACGQIAVGVCYNKDCSNRPFCAECQAYHLRDKKVHKIAHPNTFMVPGAGGSPAVLHGHRAGGGEGLPGNDDDSAVSELSNSPLPAIDPNAMAWKDLKQSDILCFRHGKPMNMYCYDHDEVICESCTNVHSLHRDCRRLEYAADIFEDKVQSTQEKLDGIEELYKQIPPIIKTTTELVKALTEKTNFTKQTIANRFNQLVNQLREQRDELLNKCDELYNVKANELNQHKDMLNRVSETFVRCSTFVTWFMGTAIPSEYMMLKTQIDQHLDELLETRSWANYQYHSVEDDCIFYRENTEFDISNAIGKVYSTPSVKNFSLARYRSPMVANQPAQFRVKVQDALKNELFLSRSNMPLLRATLRHIEDEEPTEGVVMKRHNSRSTGQYLVIVYPYKSGEHELCVYHPMRPPYDHWYVGHRETYTVIVNDADRTLMASIQPFRRM